MTTDPRTALPGDDAEERLEERRLRLLAAGRECFAEADGAAPSVGEVCARAGVSKRHFYELFDDRLDLVLALHAEAVAWFRDGFDDDADPADPTAWLARLVPSLFAKLLEDPRACATSWPACRPSTRSRRTTSPTSSSRGWCAGWVGSLTARAPRRNGSAGTRSARCSPAAPCWWSGCWPTDEPTTGTRHDGATSTDVVSVSTAALSPVLP